MHPVQYDIAFDQERNRLTSFFRLIIAIPWLIWAYVYGAIAYVAVIVAWFAMLFTGSYPPALYRFTAGFVRFMSRLVAFVVLATDDLPTFGGGPNDEHGVRIDIAEPPGSYSRAKTFFKIVLAFPQLVLSYGMQLLVGGAAFITWFRILFTGKQSATMNDTLLLGTAYYIRSTAFLLLLTEVHPRPLELYRPDYPQGTPALPAGVRATPAVEPTA